MVLERTQSAFGNDAPIYNAAGLTMFISIMPPGQGPCLHAHVKTFETFTVLDGTLEFSLNDDGGQKIVLNKWDTFSCPPGVNRGFRNVGPQDAVLLTVITGGINDRNDIGLPPAIAKQIAAIDPNALEVFKTKMGLRFDAGVSRNLLSALWVRAAPGRPARRPPRSSRASPSTRVRGAIAG